MNIVVARIFFLVLVWWICSEIAEPFFIIMGGLSVWLTWKIAERLELVSNESFFHHPKQGLQYLGWLIKEIARSAFRVTRILWQIKPRITPRLFSVESKLKSDLALSLYGNSITLTPGTVCVKITGKKVQVHALEKASIVDIKSSRMEKAVTKVMK